MNLPGARLCGAVALAALLSACATTPGRVALAPEAKSRFSGLAVLTIVPQDEVLVRAPSSGAAATGGLIGALIESKVGEGRQNTIDTTIAPLYATVDDVDFRARLAGALGKALTDGVPVQVGDVEQAGRPLSRDELDKRRAALDKQQHGLLVLKTSYAFSQDFRIMTVATSANLRKKEEDPPLFAGTYTYQSEAVGKGGDASVSDWAANHGARYRATMDQAAQQLATMIQLDLAADAKETAAPRLTSTRASDTGPKPVTGPRLAASDDRAIVRDVDGLLYSLPLTNGAQP